MQNDLDTEQKQGEAIANAQSFIVHPFWATFKGILEANIAVLKNRLATEEFEKVEMVQEIQKKIQAYQEALEVPTLIIERYSPKSSFTGEPNMDPYESIEDFRLDLKKKRNST